MEPRGTDFAKDILRTGTPSFRCCLCDWHTSHIRQAEAAAPRNRLPIGSALVFRCAETWYDSQGAGGLPAGAKHRISQDVLCGAPRLLKGRVRRSHPDRPRGGPLVLPSEKCLRGFPVHRPPTRKPDADSQPCRRSEGSQCVPLARRLPLEAVVENPLSTARSRQSGSE